MHEAKSIPSGMTKFLCYNFVMPQESGSVRELFTIISKIIMIIYICDNKEKMIRMMITVIVVLVIIVQHES